MEVVCIVMSCMNGVELHEFGELLLFEVMLNGDTK